jgi:hypothetical protein
LIALISVQVFTVLFVGIHRPVNYISGGNQNSGTYNATQTFSCSIIFSSPPRVVLGIFIHY